MHAEHERYNGIQIAQKTHSPLRVRKACKYLREVTHISHNVT